MTKNPLLVSPVFAWPTIVVLALAWAAWAAGLHAIVTGALPAALAVALSTLGAYVAFTPLHEAIHRTVARRRIANELVGRLSALLLLGPFGAVRQVHLQHHRHTNDPERDPDHWSGLGPAWLLPLRWLTQDVPYYRFLLRRQDKHARADRVESFVTLAAMLGLAIALCAAGHAREVLLGWILPARLATALLAFAFDYLPHRPHRVPASVDPLQATRIVTASPFWNVLLLGQGRHLAHHLSPGIPFYRYGAVPLRQRPAPTS